MRLRYVLAYAVIEIAAFVLMVMTLGFGWAVLISLAAVGAGLLMLQWQGRKVFAELRRASRNEVDARAPLADTALLAASTALVIVPGVVSTLAGVIMLFPPTRKLLRPAVVALGAQRVAVAMDRAGLYATGGFRGATVVEGTVVETGGDRARPADDQHDLGQLPRGRYS